MKFGVIVFPGTWSDGDCYTVIDQVLQEPVEYVWHKDDLSSSIDCVILPGGFSYGDYLRCGAIAKFSPVMESVVAFARNGGIVIGICNGFQILCETGLLPGVLIRNDNLQFRCEWSHLRVENADTRFTSLCEKDDVLAVPISHGEGNYFADEETLRNLEDRGQVAFRYCSEDGEVSGEFNPNGSLNNIAGITNLEGNVLGMMPHPERCCDSLVGGKDGEFIFRSILETNGSLDRR